VKPNETLYRVSLRYDIPVDKLKRLNRMKPDDNTIRPGQRLRVSS
jgi:membrane-bound lytic murein transglycosylase D